MAQSTFSVRMDETIKNQFDALCKEFGMNTSTAINIFAHTVVRERRIPFEISVSPTTTLDEGRFAFQNLRQSAQDSNLQDMTLDEINAEIQLVRESHS